AAATCRNGRAGGRSSRPRRPRPAAGRAPRPPSPRRPRRPLLARERYACGRPWQTSSCGSRRSPWSRVRPAALSVGARRAPATPGRDRRAVASRPVNRRWAVPAGALAFCFAVAGVPRLVSADPGAPALPPLDAEALVAKAAAAHVEGLSGTMRITANLGLPSLPGLGGPGVAAAGVNLSDLLSGTHSFDVAVAGPDEIRVTSRAPLEETNWIRNGSDLWIYES